jgi:hypothetical protein
VPRAVYSGDGMRVHYLVLSAFMHQQLQLHAAVPIVASAAHTSSVVWTLAAQYTELRYHTSNSHHPSNKKRSTKSNTQLLTVPACASYADATHYQQAAY